MDGQEPTTTTTPEIETPTTEEAAIDMISRADFDRSSAALRRKFEKKISDLENVIQTKEGILNEYTSKASADDESTENIEALKRKAERYEGQLSELQKKHEDAIARETVKTQELQTKILESRIFEQLQKNGASPTYIKYAVSDLIEASEFEQDGDGALRVITRIDGMLYEDVDGSQLGEAAKRYLASNPGMVAGPKGGTGHPQPSGANKAPDTSKMTALEKIEFGLSQ